MTAQTDTQSSAAPPAGGAEELARLAKQLLKALEDQGDIYSANTFLEQLTDAMRQTIPHRENSKDDQTQTTSARETLQSIALKWQQSLKSPGPHAPMLDLGTMPLSQLALQLSQFAEQLTDQARDQARERARQSSTQSAQTLSQIARELHGPLQQIRADLSGLAASDLTLSQREHVESASEQVDSTLHLANALTDLARVQSGRFSPNRFAFRIRDCVVSALEANRPRARARSVQLRHVIAPNVPQLLSGDPGRLRHVLSTLSGNAISAMDGGALTVNVTTRERDAHDIVLHFALQQRIEAQHPPRTSAAVWRGIGSSGLGLRVARQVVEQMGGRTWVEAASQGNSTLNFTLRLTLVAGAPTHTAVPSRDRLQSTRALVVQPRASVKNHVPGSLRRLGVEAEVATNAAVAARKLLDAAQKGRPYHAALLCAGLDDRIGRSTAEALAAMEPAHRPALAVITPSGHRGDAALCRRIGVTAYLVQPVADQDLRDALLALIDEGQTRQIRRSGLLTRHVLRELRGRATIAVMAQDAAQAQEWSRRLTTIGYRAVDMQHVTEALDPSDLPALILLVGNALSAEDAAKLDAARRRFHVFTTRAVPVLLVSANPEASDSDAGGLKANRVLPLTADSDALSNAIAELTTDMAATPTGHSLGVERLLDPEALLKRLDDDESLVTEVIELYLRDCDHMLRDLHEAIASEDGKALLGAADRFKGSFELFGLRFGTDICERLATCGLRHDMTGTGQLVEKLEALCADVRRELESERDVRHGLRT